MIDILETAKAPVIALRINGKIEKDDIVRVAGSVEQKLALHDKLGIYVEVQEFDGMTPEALWEDLKFALPNLPRFTRKAVLSDKKWMETAATIGDALTPGIRIKHFNPDERARAMTWAMPF